jgi:hypothetical protein
VGTKNQELWQQTGFPRSLFIAEDGRVVGTWIMGNDYRVRSEYYGGYPAGYLRRVRALFPDKRHVLHLFSGKVDLDALPGRSARCTGRSTIACNWRGGAGHDG